MEIRIPGSALVAGLAMACATPHIQGRQAMERMATTVEALPPYNSPEVTKAILKACGEIRDMIYPQEAIAEHFDPTTRKLYALIKDGEKYEIQVFPAQADGSVDVEHHQELCGPEQLKGRLFVQAIIIFDALNPYIGASAAWESVVKYIRKVETMTIPKAIAIAREIEFKATGVSENYDETCIKIKQDTAQRRYQECVAQVFEGQKIDKSMPHFTPEEICAPLLDVDPRPGCETQH